MERTAKYVVRLDELERGRLQEMVDQGQGSKTIRNRAWILDAGHKKFSSRRVPYFFRDKPFGANVEGLFRSLDGLRLRETEFVPVF